jgi:hypothetical protein
MILQLLAIDVLGNARDGYELNDWQDSGIRVEIHHTADETDIIKSIRAAWGHRADARGYYVEVTESTCNVFRKRDGKPAYFCNVLDADE